MQGRAWGNEYRTTIVCVDEYQDSILSGRLYHPCLSEGDSFRSLMEFFRKMEDLLDGMQFQDESGEVQEGRYLTQIRPDGDTAGSRHAGRTMCNVCSPGAVPAKCQLARVSFLAGRQSGRELPQRLGIGIFNGQRTDDQSVLTCRQRTNLPIKRK